MKVYELTVLIKPEIGEKELAKVVKDLQGLLEKVGAKIKSKKDPAKRPMAYEIVKGGRYREANYLYLEVESNPEKIGEIDKSLKLSDNIIRYLLVNHVS